ncbi:MAG: methylated-DNA--[protein]-cysteine S-methyltransferase [Eubacteriales bacterium]|nr:methylated-DNA--[protein]-cysteine S-methyltransferase [Eubacteriales bacterium]MDD4389849.1 methylated-DNA--[protein]-cysteine S-methyltransferase [Eubacteriales bacterium]
MNKYAFYDFELGILKIGINDKTVIEISTEKQIDADNEPSSLSDYVFEQVSEYLKGQRKFFDFPYEYCGTEFQKKVWDALCEIPYGETRTYKQIATQIGNPKASRAVGMANNRNPIAIVVPCHRVIGSNGSLVGYASGLDVKEFLLNLELDNR